MNTECIISSFIEYVSGFPNRQAELDLQAFPNSVWERYKNKALNTPPKNPATAVSIHTQPHPSSETRRRIEVDGLFLPVNEELTLKDNDTGVSLSKKSP